MIRTRHLVRRAIAAFAVLLTCCTFASTASAGSAGPWCDNWWSNYAACNRGVAQPLTSVVANSGTAYSTCGGAFSQISPLKVMYGSYFCATNYGCHTYGGSNNLYAGIKLNTAASIYVRGYNTWSPTGAYNGCPRGAPMSKRSRIDRASLKSSLGIFASRQRGDAIPASIAKPTLGTTSVSLSRRFSTDRGAGWIAAIDKQGICVVVQDGGTGYGSACKSQEEALSKGFSVALVGADENATLVSVEPGGDSGGLTVDETTATQARDVLNAS